MSDLGLESMSHDDLIDKYSRLDSKYSQLKKDNDELLQEIYSLKLEKNRLQSAERFLQSELESVNSVQSKELDQATSKLQHQIEELKHKEHELLTDNMRLESRCDDLTAQLEKVQHDLKEAEKSKVAKPVKPRLSDIFVKELELERTIQELDEKNKEQEEMLKDLTTQNSENLAQIEELKDKLLCSEENLESKKSELTEKDELIESLHEQLNELNMELAMLKSAPETGNRKGNSLFAEVDDQRQEIKKILQNQNKTYMEMKKSFDIQKREIRRLKRENDDIKEEIQICSSLFHRAEQMYIQSLSTRNSELTRENRLLEDKLKLMEKCLSEVGKNNGNDWIECLLTTSNKELNELKEKLYHFLLDGNQLDANFQKSQKELAKYRLEYTKLKLLLRRMQDNSNISFEELKSLDINSEILADLCMEREQTMLETSIAQFEEESLIMLPESKEVITLDDTLPDSKGVLRNAENPLKRQNASKSPESEIPTKISATLPVLTPTKTPPVPKKEEKPLQEISNSEAVGQTSKKVQFAVKTETTYIDSNLEQFQQSVAARKKSQIIVKRITIPSKVVKKKEED